MNTFKIMLASAFGAVLALMLGSHVSDHPFALWVWGMVGAFAGFVSVGPREFCVNLAHNAREALRSWRARRNEARVNARLKREKLKRHKVYLKLLREEHLYRGPVPAALVVFWIVLSLTMLIPTPPEARMNSFIFAFVLIGGCAVAVALMHVTRIIDTRSTVLAPFDESILPQKLEELSRGVIQGKKVSLYIAILPITIVGLTLKYLYYSVCWTVTNFGLVCGAVLLVLAKTCRVVVSLERYTAALGAVLGYVWGWQVDRSTFVAMIVGAAFGGGTYMFAKVLLRYLPDPDTSFEELVPTKSA